MNPATADAEAAPAGSVSILIAPHCSLNSAQALVFMASVALPCLLVSGVMTWRGYWPVLPFAGAELLLLGWALRRSLARRQQVEMITLTDSQVRIERLGGGTTERFEFPRHWAQVKLRRSDASGLLSRLMVESSGRRCEIGAFLTEAERLGLARRLRLLVGRVAESPPLASAAAEPCENLGHR